MYGRGACDMKSGLASAAFAVRALQSIGVALRGDVLLESVIGEETGGVGSLTTIVRGYRANACIIVEPMNLRIAPVQTGALTFRITVHGKGAHACMKPHGVNAITEFLPIMTALEELNSDRHRRFQDALFDDPQNVASLSVGTVRAGDWPSTVPDILVAEGRLGVFPNESTDEARAALVATVNAVASRRAWSPSIRRSSNGWKGSSRPGPPARRAHHRASVLQSRGRARCATGGVRCPVWHGHASVHASRRHSRRCCTDPATCSTLIPRTSSSRSARSSRARRCLHARCSPGAGRDRDRRGRQVARVGERQASSARAVPLPHQSCRGTPLAEAVVGFRGIVADRHWMVVDATGNFLSQRELPRMALIGPRLSGGAMEVSAPGMPALTVRIGNEAAPPR